MKQIFTLCLLAFLGTTILNAQAPVITSFAPLKGKPGDAVTLTGTGFNTTAANNIVFCGATKATVTAATTTSVTITVPIGATFNFITLLNIGNGLAANSRAKFTPTYSPAKTSITTTNFDAKVDFASSRPLEAAIADIDGDGKADILVAYSSGVSVFRNISTPGSSINFAAKLDFATPSLAGGIAVGDLDGDGKLDIAVTNYNSSGKGISVLRNTSSIGNISFATIIQVSIATATYNVGSYYKLAIADLDGDGKLDIIVSKGLNFGFVILGNTSTIGNISFALQPYLSSSYGVVNVAVGDINGDGKPDIVVLYVTSQFAGASVFINASTIGNFNFFNGPSFQTTGANGSGGILRTGPNLKFLELGDLDGDGKLDIVVALNDTWNSTNAAITLGINYQTNGFNGGSLGTRLNSTAGTNTVSLADFNGDGKLDIGLVGGAKFSIMQNTYSSGTISDANGFDLKVENTSTAGGSVIFGDLDGDGRPDAVFGSSSSISVYRNADPPCTPTSDTFTVAACGSYTWAAKGNKVYTASNNTDTIHLTNEGGCDSLVTLNLTIKSTSSSTTNTTICSSALPYSWNGLTFNAAGSQTAHLTNSVGCDSAATLNLTVKTNYTITASAGSNGNISNAGANTICEGNNQSYTITPNANYHIVDVLVNGVSQGAITTYSFTNVIANHTIAASFAANCVASNSSTTQTACVSYSWNGTTYTTSGSYIRNFTNSCGLDSAATLHLTINNATSSSTTASVCSNQLPYTWNSLTFNAAGTQTKTGLTNSKGCDSSATLILSVSTSSASSISISSTATTICAGGSVTFTATPVNGGTAPIYQWKLNGNNVGSNSNAYTSTSLNNNDSVWCVLTSNSACATNANSTSNRVKVRVNANPVVASITNGIAAITTASLCTLGSTYNYYCATGYGTWSSSNPSVASVAGRSLAAVVTANTNGTATLSYSLTSTNGCVSTSSILLTVAQQATPNAITGNSVVCAGTTTSLSNTTPSGVWSSTNDRGTINAAGVYSGNNAGTWGEVRYTVTNASGCKAFSSKSITVNAKPGVPTITYSAASAAIRSTFNVNGNFCVGKSFTVIGIPSGGSWAYTNATAGTITSGGLVTIIGVGSGAIVYTYTDANGCSNSRTMAGNTAVCPIPKGVSVSGEGLVGSSDFTMYPNPAKGFINLNIKTLVGAGSIVITDLYGKTVKTQALSMGTNTVDIANLNKGIYFVSLITSEGKTTKKLVVE